VACVPVLVSWAAWVLAMLASTIGRFVGLHCTTKLERRVNARPARSGSVRLDMASLVALKDGTG
jgi:hypothetical protein